MVTVNYPNNKKCQKRDGEVAVVMCYPCVMLPSLCCTSSDFLPQYPKTRGLFYQRGLRSENSGDGEGRWSGCYDNMIKDHISRTCRSGTGMQFCWGGRHILLFHSNFFFFPLFWAGLGSNQENENGHGKVQKSWNFVISHGILPILPANLIKFVFFCHR